MFDPPDLNSKNDFVISDSRFTSSAILEIQNRKIPEKGVSTNCIHFLSNHLEHKEDTESHWYALRATYGQERKAYEYIISKNGIAFYPTMKECRLVNNKRVFLETSMLPNMLFAYGTEEKIKSFVYDNVNLPFLRFYYSHRNLGNKVIKEPLIVPDNQLETLRIICNRNTDDIILKTDEISKFKTGQLVRVIEGNFKGVVGTVARYQGQQRVGIVIDGFITAVTAYIPNAFLKVQK